MNLLSLAAVGAVALLSVTDPTGDANGDGTLTPPTSPIYAHSAIFDLQELDLSTSLVTSDGGDVVKVPATILSVTLGAVAPDDTAPAGFSGVVVDVYLDFAVGGSDTTLVGPGMLLPFDSGWDYAVRLSPAGAFGVAYYEAEDTTAVTPSGSSGSPEPSGPSSADESSPAAAADGESDQDLGVSDTGDLDLEPLALRIEGNRLIVDLPMQVSEDVKVYAVTGVYDPFASTSWRPLATTTSPWAYSGGEQVVPVIDVLAVDQAAQTKALQTGALPRQLSTADRGIIWLVLMGAGLLVASAGLWFRQRVVPEARTGLPYGLPPDPDVVPVDTVDEPDEAEQLEAAAEPEGVEELKAAAEPSSEPSSEPSPNEAAEVAETQTDTHDAFDMFGVQLDEEDDEDDDVDFLNAGLTSSDESA